MNALIQRIQALFDVTGAPQRNNLAFVQVDPDHLPALLTHLKDYEAFTQLIFLTPWTASRRDSSSLPICWPTRSPPATWACGSASTATRPS